MSNGDTSTHKDCCSITEFMHDGVLVRAFTCRGDPDERAERYAQIQMQLDKWEYENRLEAKRTDYWNPNTCDTRNVRKELGDKLVNLGFRQNRVKRRR